VKEIVLRSNFGSSHTRRSPKGEVLTLLHRSPASRRNADEQSHLTHYRHLPDESQIGVADQRQHSCNLIFAERIRLGIPSPTRDAGESSAFRDTLQLCESSAFRDTLQLCEYSPRCTPLAGCALRHVEEA
jgi:hypothetical protein